MIDLITIISVVVFAAGLFLILRKLDLTWADTPSRPITPTPKAVPDKDA